MIYIFDDEAGKETLHVRDDLYKYLVKVRRYVEGDEISIRSREDVKTLHSYRVVDVEPRSLELSLI
ncbi:MAG: hypothetical protein L3J19_02595 [Sulfurimonas sp.]|nr:hypothetical protein [Sulfurimonas sp.]